MLVRQMLAGVAEAVELDANDLNDISTAVTEACNNVVLHAYGDAEGLLEVEVQTLPGTVEVLVRDHGGGIPATVGAPTEKAGMGLSVIQTLAERSDSGLRTAVEPRFGCFSRRRRHERLRPFRMTSWSSPPSPRRPQTPSRSPSRRPRLHGQFFLAC